MIASALWRRAAAAAERNADARVGTSLPEGTRARGSPDQQLGSDADQKVVCIAVVAVRRSDRDQTFRPAVTLIYRNGDFRGVRDITAAKPPQVSGWPQQAYFTFAN